MAIHTEKLFGLVPKRIKSYSSFLCWLIPDSLWRNKGLSFLILATGFLGVSFQVQVFALIIYYARHFSSGELILFWGYEFDPRISVRLLVGVSFGIMVSFMLASASIYYSRRSALALGRKYEEFCAKRVYHLLSENIDVFGSMAHDMSQNKYLFKLVRMDSRFCNRVLRMLLNLNIPALTLAVAFGGLIYLEPVLTLFIIMMMAIFAYFQYRVSRTGAGHSQRFEKLARVASLEQRGLIEHFKQQPESGTAKDLVERTYFSGAAKKRLDAYEGRLRAVENSRLVSGIFIAVVLAMILTVMGGNIISRGSGWGRLVVYIVALRFAMANLQNSFALVTSISRFYPQVRRYYLFVHSLKSDGRDGYTPLERYELHVGMKRLVGSQDRLILEKGSRLALVTPLALNRYTLASITRSLLGDSEGVFKSALYSMRFATRRHSCPDTSLRQVLGLDDRASWPDLKARFTDEKLWHKMQEQLPGNLDTQIKPKNWDRLEPTLKFALSLISAANSDCRWVLVEAKALGLLGQGSARFYLDLFKDKIVVLVFNEDISGVRAYGEDGVAVATEEELLGLGSPEWIADVRSEVEEILDLGILKKKRKAGAEEEDEDELEDEE